MNNYNVVGDIAGEFLTLKALLAKMPQDATLISLGDPNDRGPQSKEVIEFLMKNGHTVQSNHAHLMTEAWDQSSSPGVKPRYYEYDLWPSCNGGIQTMDSYAGIGPNNWGSLGKKLHELIPVDHIEWLKSCPMWIESENFVFTHAPLHSQLSLMDAAELGGGFDETYDPQSQYSLIWNRYVGERPNKFLGGLINIFGHNSSNAVKVYTTQFPLGIKVDNEQLKEIWNRKEEYPIYGICLDTSSARILTGLHLPTMTLYTQEYI